jgi:hypothetical protein
MAEHKPDISTVSPYKLKKLHTDYFSAAVNIMRPVEAIRCGLIYGIFMVVAHNLILSSDIPSWTR